MGQSGQAGQWRWAWSVSHCSGTDSPASLVSCGLTPRGGGPYRLYKGRGCPTCNFTGVKGRLAVYEILPVSREIRDLIIRTASPSAIAKVAGKQGMRTLREGALNKVLEGLTTLEEALRVTSD